MNSVRLSRWVTAAALIAIVIGLVPSFSAVDAAGGVMAYGDVVSGQITNKSYVEVWEFEGSKGDRVQILMEGSGGLDPYLGLINAANEQVLAEDDDSAGSSNAYIEMSLPATGTFWIVATRYDLDAGTSQGSYELALSSSSTTQSTTNVSATTTTEPVELEPGIFYMSDLALDETVGGSIDNASFAHLYGIELDAGTELVIVMLADESRVDPYLIFMDEDGNTLAEDDDSGAQLDGAGKTDAFVYLTVPKAGLYFVAATRAGLDTGKSSGAYVLVAAVPAAEGPVEPVDEPAESDLPPGMEAFGMIEVGMTANETISDDSYFHLYGLEGQAGDEVTITMRGEGGLDAYLGLLDPSDEVVAEDDDSAGGMDAQLTLTLPESGVYLLVASRSGLDAGSTTGAYTLEIISGPPEASSSESGTLSFTGLPGRSLMNESGDTFYLSGTGWSDDPAKNTAIEAFAGSGLPGRGDTLKTLAGATQLRPRFSLNFEEIKVD